MENERFNKDDATKYYDLLNHSYETELRLYNNKGRVPAKKMFVTGKSDFISKIEENLENNLNISAGINERESQKSGDDDVRFFGTVLIDFDAHDESESIDAVEKQANDLMLRFSNLDIKSSLAKSGRGYHILIPFKPVEITNENRDEWKNKIKTLRKHFVEKFGVDSSTFNLSRVSRVIGTYNIEAGTVSRWIDYKGYNDNFEFIDLINELYKHRETIDKVTKAVKSGVIDDDLETNRQCPFFDKTALSTKFPEGERYNILVKNMAMYTNFIGKLDKRKKFCEFQDIPEQEFEGWDGAFKTGSFKKFNCGEIFNYSHRHGLKDVCNGCPYNNFRFSPAKIEFKNKVAKKAKFEVVKNLYQCGLTTIGQYGVITKKPIYSIHEISFLVGNPRAYAITINSSDLREGDNERFIIPLRANESLYEKFKNHPPNNILLLKIAKNLGIAEKDSKQMIKDNTFFDYIISEDLRHLDPILVTLGAGVDENDIKSLSNDDTKKIVEDYTTLGLSVDSSIILEMESKFFIPDITKTNFRTYQFYNPHSFCFTDTKAGKTTISSRIGHNAIRSTVKNLLGFATSDEINRGTLHNNIYPYFLDELSIDDSKSTYGKLLSYMEMGNVNIDVGKKSITCEGLSPLTFMGNPKDSLDPRDRNSSVIDIVNQFNNTLRMITDNFVAFGSRIGLVIFDPNTKRISGHQKFNEDEYDVLTAKYEYLRTMAAPIFSDLFRKKKIQRFLDTPFDKKYLDTIMMVADKATIESVKGFMRGSENSYKHMNGLALRLGCLEYLNDIINDNYDVGRIIEKSKEFLETCKSINLQSFKRMVDNPAVDEFIAKGYKKDYENEFLENKCVLSAIYNYIRANGKTKTVYTADIEKYILEDDNRPDGRGPTSIIERCNMQRLEHHYRIEYNRLDAIAYFSIKDVKPLISIFGAFEEGNIFQAAEQLKIIIPKGVKE